ncbi:MAG: UDP-glucose 4-epimerase, partial [Magnetococcales bacterium]|nr:UDP-glucose 4-epimerase [Magnetococcales bacterium]
MSTILVTGGAGYVGSHVCKALAAAGHQPVVFDNLERGHRWAVKWGPFEEGDILDPTALDRAFETHRPDAVMHFAALAYVGESVEHPGRYHRSNIMGSIQLLEAMRRHAVTRLIFSSSCATYGHAEQLPIPETAPQNPINPYGFTKLTVERIISDHADVYGLRACSLRYFNAAGCDPDGETG